MTLIRYFFEQHPILASLAVLLLVVLAFGWWVMYRSAVDANKLGWKHSFLHRNRRKS